MQGMLIVKYLPLYYKYFHQYWKNEHGKYYFTYLYFFILIAKQLLLDFYIMMKKTHKK